MQVLETRVFRDAILKKVTTRGRDHICLLPSAFLRHHSRSTIERLQRPELCSEPKRSTRTEGKNRGKENRELLSVFFFLEKQASIVWSVHSAFQHSDGSGGDSPIVREATLVPSGLVRFERHLVSPCPRSQNPSHRAALPTGPRSTNP